MIRKTLLWQLALLLILDALVSMRIRLNVGNLVLLFVGAAMLGGCLFPQAYRQAWDGVRATAVGRVVLYIAGGVLAALLALFLTVSVCMIAAERRQPRPGSTVIVLGAGIYDDRPSRILSERLDAAAERLLADPQALCIVTGGQGPDEITTEASVMRRELIARGIAAERIYMEEESESTFENLRNAAEIIRREGLPTDVTVVTQGFHQLRGQSFARQAGLQNVGATVADTPLYLLAPYWIREFAGICHMVLLGY